jgi:hypothetical protein
MIRESDIAYIAGLFDGEGSVYFKKTKQTRHQRPGKPIHNVTVIRMEIAMTDESILRWIYEVLKVGKVGPRKVRPGRKKQWRWRCSHRDAYYVCCLLYPYSHVKLDKIHRIINHYDGKIMGGNVVDLELYKKAMALE